MKSISKLLIIFITFQINCALHKKSSSNIFCLLKDKNNSDKIIKEIALLDGNQFNSVIKKIFKKLKYRWVFDKLLVSDQIKIWNVAKANKDFDCMEYIIASKVIHPHFIISECKNGDLDMMKYMINNRLSLINCIDYRGYDLLHIACEYGYLDMVKYFISKRSELNLVTRSKRTPLHIACYGWLFDIVKELLKYKPKLELQDNLGLTPLGAAIYSNNFDIAIFLLKKGAAFPKNISCYMKLEPIVKFLKKLDTDIIKYISIAHLGRYIKERPIIQILLQQSIDPDSSTTLDSFNESQEVISNAIIIGNLNEIKIIPSSDISDLFSNSHIAKLIVQKLYSDSYDDMAMQELIKKVAIKYTLKDLFYNDNNIIWEVLTKNKRNLAILILSISPGVLEYLPKELNPNNSLLLLDIYRELNCPKNKA